MSEKNVAIRYLGGCGGHFVNYFLLASGKYATRYYITNKNKKLKIDIRPGDLKIVSRLFYQQFGDKREWLSDEIWPDNTECDFSPRLFLYCDDGTPEKNKDIINVCPYISDFKDWFRTVLYKRTN